MIQALFVFWAATIGFAFGLASMLGWPPSGFSFLYCSSSFLILPPYRKTHTSCANLLCFLNVLSLFQNDLELLNIQVNLCQLIYRYLVKEASSDQLTSSKTNPDHEESPTSLMNLSEQFTDLNPDEKTRLLIGLIDDIHDCADIMQQRSLVF